MVEEFKKSEQDLKAQIIESYQENESIKEKIECMKKDQNKKFSQIYRELEKLGLALERKVSQDELNERMDQKTDKITVANAISVKANKSEVDQILIQKADIKEVDKLLMALESKYD